ncbi:MAG TPA: hypothetical protein VGM03_03210 [Phycisphaerae bacterium]
MKLRLTGAALLLAIVTGCASAVRPGELPLGQWSGSGRVAYEVWKDSDDAKADSISRTYATRMSIQLAQIDGHAVTLIEIFSERGTLPVKDWGDQTHLKIALVPAKRVSDAMVLYRVVALDFNPKPTDHLHVDEKAQPVSASCTMLEGDSVLLIHYGDGAVDSLRFAGNMVEKAGLIASDDGEVHWAERLHQR